MNEINCQFNKLTKEITVVDRTRCNLLARHSVGRYLPKVDRVLT